MTTYATYSPKQIKVEIVHVDNYTHRRGTVVTIRTLDGTRPFKAYTNGDGDTAMTDTTYVPQALLKDITSDAPAPLTAAEHAEVDAALRVVKAGMQAGRMERLERADGVRENAAHIGHGVWYDGFDTTPYIAVEQASRLAAVVLSRQIVNNL